MKKTFVIAIIVTLATVLTFCGFNYYNATTVGYTVEIEEGHSFTCNDCIEKAKETEIDTILAPVTSAPAPTRFNVDEVKIVKAEKIGMTDEDRYEAAVRSLVSSKEENRIVISTKVRDDKLIYAIYNLKKGDTVKIEGATNNEIITQETDFLVGSFEIKKCNECSKIEHVIEYSDASDEYSFSVYNENGDLIEKY